MSRVQATNTVFRVEEYEDNPTLFSKALEAAKINPGYASCLCCDSRPKLVIRRISSKEGDRFFLATWPNTGTDHTPECRFHHSEDDYEQGRAKRLAAVLASDEGFTIKPDFALLRTTETATQPRGPLSESTPAAAGTQRATLGLLGTLEFIWQSAGLNRWLSSYKSAAPQRWTNLVTRVNSVLSQGKLGGRRLSDILYVVPAYSQEHQQAINERFNAMVQAHRPTDTTVPAFLIIGEVSQAMAAGKAILVRLRHQFEPLWLFPSLSSKIAERYRAAEAVLESQNKEGRVIGLFAVEVTSKGSLWVKDAALMACSREYIPCDSSHEIKLANILTQKSRSFIKPLRIEDEQDLLPDFKLLDCELPTIMEVWGMNTPEYNAHRHEKVERYKTSGIRLWQWDAFSNPEPPPLPPSSPQQN